MELLAPAWPVLIVTWGAVNQQMKISVSPSAFQIDNKSLQPQLFSSLHSHRSPLLRCLLSQHWRRPGHSSKMLAHGTRGLAQSSTGTEASSTCSRQPEPERAFAQTMPSPQGPLKDSVPCLRVSGPGLGHEDAEGHVVPRTPH